MVATRLLPSSGGFAPVGTRRALLGGGLIVRASEDFTAADGTLITALALPWTQNGTLSGNTVAPAIDSGRAHNENAATVSVYSRSDFVPTSANYRVEADVVALSLANGAGIVGRLSAGNCYRAQYTGGVGWRLFWQHGSLTQLGSTVAATLTLGQVYRLALVMQNDQISLEVDGSRIITATDTNITSSGSAGLVFQAAATSTTGIHLDAWRVLQ